MNSNILAMVGQIGLSNGALYALIAIALVLVFCTTKVVFVPIGECVSFGALTLAALDHGRIEPVVWGMVGLGLASGAMRLRCERSELDRRGFLRIVFWHALCPALWLILIKALPGSLLERAASSLLVVPFILAAYALVGVYLYELIYRSLLERSVLTLLIVSVALHGLAVGVALILFGAEGARSSIEWGEGIHFGMVRVDGPSLAIFVATCLLIALLSVFFDRTLLGKALRATAVNRLGAQLAAISPAYCGRMAFAIAAAIGSLTGVLLSSTTPVFYDTGFLTGLKGFVAAIIGGLASYPAAATAAVLVGQMESFTSFYASPFKEVLVFTLIVPVLLWRSSRALVLEDDQ